MASRDTYSCGDVFSKEDLSLLARSLQDEQFRALFSEYAKEVCEPENQKQFERELKQMEKERGVEAVFIHPSPGFVLAVGGQDGGPVFVNICASEVVQRPSFVNVDDGVMVGQNWSLPHALPKPRREWLSNKVRVSGVCGQAMVHDVVFHPEALHLASTNPFMKHTLIQTAVESLSKTFQLKIGQPQELGSVKYVGKPIRSVIKRVVDMKLFEESEKMSFQHDERTSGGLKTTENKNKMALEKSTNSVMQVVGPLKPQYKIKHVSKVDLQDFSVQLIPQCGPAWRPQALEVEVELPGVARASQVNANVWPQSILLSTNSDPQYKLDLPLPYPVDEDSSAAKFDLSTQKLTLTLSVIPARKKDQVSVYDYSPSSDSGIECEPDYRTNSDGDNSSEVSVSSQEDRLKEVNAAQEDDSVFETQSQVRATLVPGYSVKQSLESLYVILHCGNVLPSSVTAKQIDDQTVSVELSSIGGGHTLLHYGLKIVSRPNHIAKSGVTYKLENGTVEIIIKKAVAELWESCQIGDGENTTTVVPTPASALDADTKSSQKQTKDTEDCTNKNVITAKKEEKTKDGSEGSKVVPRVPRMSRTVSMCETGTAQTVRLRGPTCSWPRGILKCRTRSLSESHIGSFTPVAPLELESSSTDLKVLEDKQREYKEEGEESVEESISSSLGEKKSVRFNEVVSRQLFRSNSSILGQRAKNQRKAMRKRKGQQRRASESDRENDQGQQSSDPLPVAVSNSTDEDTDATTTDTTEVDDLDDINLHSISLDVKNNNNVNNSNSHIYNSSNANNPESSNHNEKENINNNKNIIGNNSDGINNENSYDGFVVKTSKKKRKSKKNTTFEPSNNFIFQLDIDN